MNRYQFAVKVANVFGLSTENIVVPVMTSDLGQVAPRPLKAGMKCDRLLKTLNWNLCGSVEGLEYFKQTQIL